MYLEAVSPVRTQMARQCVKGAHLKKCNLEEFRKGQRASQVQSERWIVVGGKCDPLAALPPGKRPGAHCTVVPSDGQDCWGISLPPTGI